MRRAMRTTSRRNRPPSRRSSSATPSPARAPSDRSMAETALPDEAAAFLRQSLGGDWSVEPLAGDASVRRYFRIRLSDGSTRMLAWYPPEVVPQLRRFLDAYAAVKPHAYVPTITHQNECAALQEDVGDRSLF